MSIIAVANQKGGVGKTTTAVSLAACLAESGQRILLVDLDPQANASGWLGAGDGGRAVVRILTELDPIDSYVIGSNTQGVDLIPGSKWSASAESRLTSEKIEGHPESLRLREALHAVNGRYDHVIVDTPPGLGWLSSNAIHAADMLLIPVEAHVMALAAVANLLESVEKWGGSPATHILPVRVDRRNRHTGAVVERLREEYGDRVTATEIRENVRVAESWGWKQPVTTYDPKSPGAVDYRAATAELFKTSTTQEH